MWRHQHSCLGSWVILMYGQDEVAVVSSILSLEKNLVFQEIENCSQITRSTWLISGYTGLEVLVVGLYHTVFFKLVF